MSAPTLAAVFVENRLVGETTDLGEGLVLLDYASGDHLLVSGAADWNDGIHSGTDVASDGSLRLDHRGDVVVDPARPWWDAAWALRRCVTVTNPGAALTEHPVSVRLDTASWITEGDLLPSGADLRAVDPLSGDVLPLWIEGPVPAASTLVWVQLAAVPSGTSSFCFYLGNPTATTVSDELEVFTYSTAKARYYTGNRGWNGQTLSLVSYTDNNTVIVDGSAAVLNRGQVRNVTATQHTVIQTSGPVAGGSIAGGTDTIIPEAWASSSFVFAVNRNQQHVWVRSPFATATIQFLVNGAVINTSRIGVGGPPVAGHTVTPADGAVGFVADAGNGEAVMVRSTNGVAFVASHITNTSTDGLVGVPWTGEALYGVKTRTMQVGGGAVAVNYSALGSDGITHTQGVGPTALASHPGGASRGAGPGVRIAGDQPFAAAQFADGNGNESTSFQPLSLLEHTYRLPVGANYVSMVCPTPGQTVAVTPPAGATTTLTCTNPGGLAGAPGHAYSGLTWLPAGTLLTSEAGFHAIFEKSNNDEQNLIGAKAARPRVAVEPSLTPGPLEGWYVPLGTWQSPVYDTTTPGIFGHLALAAAAAPGTTVTVRMATGASVAEAEAATPVGPDGTPATAYASGSAVVPGGHDRERFVRFVVALSTSDTTVSPSLSEVDLTYDLEQFATTGVASTEITVPVGPGPSSHLLARIHGSGTLSYTTQIRYRSGSGLPAVNALAVRTDHPADHVIVGGGSIVQGQGPAFASTPGSSFSLWIDADLVPAETATVEVTLAATQSGGAVVEHDIRFVLLAP